MCARGNRFTAVVAAESRSKDERSKEPMCLQSSPQNKLYIPSVETQLEHQITENPLKEILNPLEAATAGECNKAVVVLNRI